MPVMRVVCPLYWFTVQIAMICGYFTTLPANYWLVKAGVKEAMD